MRWWICRLRCPPPWPVSRSPPCWLGQTAGGILEPLGIQLAFKPAGIVIALIFIGLPFVVRTVQPVLEDAEKELEEAATCLGANALADLHQGHPALITPALLTGFAMAFARAVGEYGSVIFIAGNMPMVSGDHAAHHHRQAGAIRLRWRHRRGRGDAGHLVHPAAGHQRAANLAAPPRRGSGMSGANPSTRRASGHHRAPWVRWTLIGLALAFLLLFWCCRWPPFYRGAAQGFGAYLEGLREPDAWSAIRLTLLTAADCRAAEPGVWRGGGLVHRQVRVQGQGVLTTLMDLPFPSRPWWRA